MKLTRLQYKALKVYQSYHTSGLTIGQLLRNCWRQWLLLAVIGVMVYWIVVPVTQLFGWLYLGICIGAFLRDIGHFQVAFRIWPVTQQIIEWERVSEMIESHERDNA